MRRNPNLPTHHSWADLQRIAFRDPIVATVLTCQRDHGWTREEALLILVTAMMQARDECQKAYERQMIARGASAFLLQPEDESKT